MKATGSTFSIDSHTAKNQELFTDEEWAFHMIHNDNTRSQGICKICNTYGWNYTRSEIKK